MPPSHMYAAALNHFQGYHVIRALGMSRTGSLRHVEAAGKSLVCRATASPNPRGGMDGAEVRIMGA